MLFVCTANISRSPYAERRAAQILAAIGGGPVALGSAGIPGVPGRGMDPEMAAQLSARGGQPDGHVSRSLTRADLDRTALVLTFELAQRVRIIDAWPDQAVKVFGLHQFADALSRVRSPGRGLELLDQVYAATRADRVMADVADPYRRGTTAARACATEIDALLAGIVPALAGRPRVRGVRVKRQRQRRKWEPSRSPLATAARSDALPVPLTELVDMA